MSVKISHVTPFLLRNWKLISKQVLWSFVYCFRLLCLNVNSLFLFCMVYVVVFFRNWTMNSKKAQTLLLGIIFTPNVSCCRWFFHILSMLLLERAHNHLTTSWGLPSFQHWELRWSLSSCMGCFALYSNEKYISQLRWVQIEKMCSYLFYIYMLFVWCYYFLAVDRGHYTFFLETCV